MNAKFIIAVLLLPYFCHSHVHAQNRSHPAGKAGKAIDTSRRSFLLRHPTIGPQMDIKNGSELSHKYQVPIIHPYIKQKSFRDDQWSWFKSQLTPWNIFEASNRDEVLRKGEAPEAIAVSMAEKAASAIYTIWRYKHGGHQTRDWLNSYHPIDSHTHRRVSAGGSK